MLQEFFAVPVLGTLLNKKDLFQIIVPCRGNPHRIIIQWVGLAIHTAAFIGR